MNKLINEFGEFAYDLCWSKKIKAPSFNKDKTINLEVDGEGDESEFEKEQLLVLLTLEKNMQKLIENSEREIFIEYDNYKNAIYSLKSIIVPFNFDPNILECVFYYNCSWDPRGGVAIVFKNEKFDRIGDFGIIDGMN